MSRQVMRESWSFESAWQRGKLSEKRLFRLMAGFGESACLLVVRKSLALEGETDVYSKNTTM